MKNKQELIEKLNNDYLDIIESKEYNIGRKICMFSNLIKKGKFITLFKKIITSSRVKKYYNPTKYKEINNNINYKNKKVVVYTCMIGDYDFIKEPKYICSNCDYYIITDSKKKFNTLNRISVSNKIKEKFNNNNILINRYYKMNPFSLFKGYDYAIYIDSNFEIISDISKLVQKINTKYGIAMHAHSKINCIYDEAKLCKILKKGNSKKIDEQMLRYKREKFPNNYGMLECGIIVTDLNNKHAKKIMEEWWKEFSASESLRDQLALPYILWKNNIIIEDLTGLGRNVFKNSTYRINKYHK